jgi:hypothetical protein
MAKQKPEEKPVDDDDFTPEEAEEVLEELTDNTHEVLKSAIDRAGPKRVARALDVSLSLVYKWTQEPRTKRNPAASGARNPLDKLVTVFHLSQDLDLIQHLCRIAGGYYTENPDMKNTRELSFVTATVTALNDFADLLQFAEKSLTDDGQIDSSESAKLRKHWDKLKGQLEHFIVSCEEGQFDISGEED